MGIRRWHCNENEKRTWLPLALIDARWFDHGADVNELAAYRVELEGRIAAYEQQEQDALTTLRAQHEFGLEQRPTSQDLDLYNPYEHINEQAVARI